MQMRKALWLFLFLLSALKTFKHISAAEVVLCQKSEIRRKTTCILRYDPDTPVSKKNQVVIVNDSGTWVGSGYVQMIQTPYFLGHFSEDHPIKKGYKARVIPFSQ